MTPTRIELVLPPWKGDVLTAWPRSHVFVSFLRYYKTPRVGLEPTTLRLTAECSTIELSRNIFRYILFLTYLQNHIQNTISFRFLQVLFSLFFLTLPFSLRKSSSSFLHAWISLRPISSSQLHALLHFHLCPIYLVFFKGSWDISSWGGLHA